MSLTNQDNIAEKYKMKNKLLSGIFAIMLILLVATTASAITFLTYCRDIETKDPIACDVSIGSATKHAGGQDDKASFILQTNTIYDIVYRNDAEYYKGDIDPVFFDDGLYYCGSGSDCNIRVGNFKTDCEWDRDDNRWYCTTEDINTHQKIYFVYLGNVNGHYTVGRVDYLKLDNAPEISEISAQTVTESGSFSYQVEASDMDGDTLHYSIFASQGGVNLTSSTINISIDSSGLITWDTSYADSGTYTVTVTIRDHYKTVTKSFDLTVDNKNRAPDVTDPSIDDSQTYRTIDSIICIGGTASDLDGDGTTSSYRWYRSDNLVSGETNDILDCSISGHCDKDDEIYCEQRVTDDDSDPLSSDWKASNKVTIANTAPSITTSATTSATEDSAYAYDVNANDIDSDTLTYSLTTTPSGMSIDSSTGEITWTPNNTHVGDNDVVVEVTDGTATDTQSFTISISNTNDDPIIGTSAVISATEDSAYAYDVNASDMDAGDSLTYSLTTSPSGMSIDSITGEITWTPDNSQVGNNNVIVTVDDANGGSVNQSFPIAVANQDPTITAIADQSATEDSQFTYNIESDDEGVGSTTYSLTTSPNGMGINQDTGAIIWTPDNTQVGTPDVVVEVDDGNGGTDTESFSITVANNPPTITAIADQVAVEDSPFVYNVESDDEGEGATYSLTTPPSGMVVNDSTGIITWTPLNQHVGVNNIDVEVNDGTDTDTESFVINVTNTNDVPVINSTPITTATQDTLYNYDVDANDVDVGDSLTFSLTNNPAGMTIDSNTGLISWTPTNAQSIGDQLHNVAVQVQDTSSATDNQAFTITAYNVNDAPTLEAALADMSFVEDTYNDTTDLSTIFNDIDNSTLLYSYQSTDANVTLNFVNTIMNVSTLANWDKAANITIIASDGEYDVNDTFQLTILGINDTPIIIDYYPLNDSVINESFNQILNFTAIDVEGDTLSTFWFINDSIISNNDNYAYDFDTNFTQAGSYNISAVVTDGNSNASVSWIVDVLNMSGNLTPELSAAFILNPSNPMEGELTTVTVDVNNSGVSNAKNFTLKYFVDDILNQTLDFTVMALSQEQVNFTWPAVYGTHNFTVKLDTINIIPEEWGAGENNNNITQIIHSKLWHTFNGAVTGNLVLADSAVNSMINWTASLGNVYAYDTDSVIDWTALAPLNVSGDLAEASNALNMGSGTKTIAYLYSLSTTEDFEVYGKTLTAPVDSTINGFNTGILWDSSDGAEYNGTQDLVFVSKLNVSNNYEIKVPASLRSYTGATDTIQLWVEPR